MFNTTIFAEIMHARLLVFVSCDTICICYQTVIILSQRVIACCRQVITFKKNYHAYWKQTQMLDVFVREVHLFNHLCSPEAHTPIVQCLPWQIQLLMCTYIYIYIYVYIYSLYVRVYILYIDIYIERERERERSYILHRCISYTSPMYIYIYTYT